MKRSWAILLLTFGSLGTVSAAIHPVPLQFNVDTPQCLECHADKTKGKSVHSAMQMGCKTCHEIRVTRDTTRVKLTTPTVSSLCINCHGDKRAADIKGKVHPPAVRDCIKCHDPHASDNKNQLLKATAGENKDTNLCLTCHKTGTEIPKGGSRHAALDMGCDTCHVAHKSGEPGKREFDFHLTKDAPALCVDCHDPKDEAIAKAHQNQPITGSDCLTCHDPHQSSQPKLMAKFTHAPFAAGQCDTCHAPAKDGKVVLTQADAKSLCVTCHSDKAEQIEKAKVQHPGAAGDCTDCHNPHGGRSPGFPKPDAVNVCLGCHAEQAEQHKKKYLHQPVFVQGCSTCHEPHGNDNEHLLRVAGTNKLCLECHGPDRKPQELKNDHLVAIFDGKVKLPENYFAKTPTLLLKYNLGHPTVGHPVSDVVDPQDITKVKTPLNCLTCHQPHSSTQPDLLAKDQANNALFCASCHKDLSK